jgi:hypothetical protein
MPGSRKNIPNVVNLKVYLDQICLYGRLAKLPQFQQFSALLAYL